MSYRKKNMRISKGGVFVLTAAVLWGVSGTFAQFLFQERDIEAEWLVSIRLLFAGSSLVLYSLVKNKKETFLVWKQAKDIREQIMFGLFGMLGVQLTYFSAIKHSNAATATVMQYLGPVLIAAYYSLVRKRWPSKREALAIVLAISGTFLLVTHGDIGKLSITPVAFVWGICAAFALAFNSIFPIRLLKRFESTAVIGWGMLIGGLLSGIITRPWIVPGTWDIYTFAFCGFILILGSLVPFYLYLNAVKMIGAETSSLMASVQPLSATLLAVIWLQVPFIFADWLGAIFIIATIVILAKKT